MAKVVEAASEFSSWSGVLDLLAAGATPPLPAFVASAIEGFARFAILSAVDVPAESAPSKFACATDEREGDGCALIVIFGLLVAGKS